MLTDSGAGGFSFASHVSLLRAYLENRARLVDRIQELLNAQRRPVHYLQDRTLLARQFEDCFFTPPAIGGQWLGLRGQLQEAHWKSGFRPRQATALHNDLIHPAEMMIRAFFCWQQTRWPGRNARVRYAETLFNVYLLRNLELLCMRIWDDESGGAGARLAEVQAVLDELWRGSPADQPVILRDARWLIPLAQSPTTDELFAYFDVVQKVAERLPEADSLEAQKASVLMIGGHLRSQIRHYCMADKLSIDDASVIRRTRTSNALDFALLIQGLVPLLEAYERAAGSGDGDARVAFANVICQGVSPDPELFLNRTDLLGAYGMIEHLFVRTDDSGVDYTPMGQRHVDFLGRYAGLIERLAPRLSEDCVRFEPVEGACSPYGVIYGTPSNLTEHMALKAMDRDAEMRFSLEDVFVHDDASAAKLAWVDGWRDLPHIDAETKRLHAYPHEFAREIYGRIERELRVGAASAASAADAAGAASAAAPAAPRTGRLFIGDCAGAAEPALPAGPAVPAASAALSRAAVDKLPISYIGSSDPEVVAAGWAGPVDATQLLRDRQEGHFVVSYASAGGWVAISKNLLTEVLGAGLDACVPGLPRPAAGVLRLTCPGLTTDTDRLQ